MIYLNIYICINDFLFLTLKRKKRGKKTAIEDEQGGKEEPSLIDIASGEGEETSPAPTTTAALAAKTDSPRKKSPAREAKKEGK